MKKCICGFLLCVWMALDATPAQVILIRHGEKPPEGNHLSLEGEERAAALAPFFLGNSAVTEYGTPVALFAAHYQTQVRSVRSAETLQPLSQALGIPVNTNYEKDDYERLAQEILNNPAYTGKMVLIAWEHHRLTDLAKALGVQDPPKWHGKDFDRLWILTFKDKGVKFTDLSQKLMYGDASH